MAFLTYNPGDINVWFVPGHNPNVLVFEDFDTRTVNEFAPGTFVTAERPNDVWDSVVDVKGNLIRVENRNTSGIVTLSIFAGTDSSNYFNVLLQRDVLQHLPKGDLYIQVIRNFGPDLSPAAGSVPTVQAKGCYIKSFPRTAFGEDAPVIDWVFQCDELIVNPVYLQDKATVYTV